MVTLGKKCIGRITEKNELMFGSASKTGPGRF